MFCRYCGKELANTAKFCRFCGKEVKVSPEVRGVSEQKEAPAQQNTSGQNVASPSASSQFQPKPQSTQVSAKSDDGGVLDVYIDGLKEKLAKTNNPLLQGRSLENVMQGVCWALMVLSFILPFYVTKETKYTEPDSYSAIAMMFDLFTGSNGASRYASDFSFMAPMFLLFAGFIVMLVFLGKLIYDNKNTIKSNRNMIIWSCVDLAYQALIFWFVAFSNEGFNDRISSKITYHPYDAGVAVYLSLLGAIVIIIVAACAIKELKEKQQNSVSDAQTAAVSATNNGDGPVAS